MFGTRTQFRVGGLSIVHNHGDRGWWFAVQVSELCNDEMHATGLDAHITLFYLRSDQHLGEEVAAELRRSLRSIISRRGTLPVDFNASGGVSPYSDEHRAMIDVLVACPAHATLHRLANEGLARVRRRQHAYVHPAFHLSILWAETATMQPATAGLTTGLRCLRASAA